MTSSSNLCLKIKIYRTIILHAVFYACETFSITLREEGKKKKRQKETDVKKAEENEQTKVLSIAACAEVPRLCSKYHISLKSCHSTQFPSDRNSNSSSPTGRYIWLAYLS
jgi:hypothetical protein